MIDLSGLPSMEYFFEVDITGNETGKKYQGKFTYKRLNYSLKNEAAKLTAQLSGDLTSIDSSIKTINFMLGILKYGLISSPVWWEESSFGLLLYDDNVILEIYKKIDAFESKWRDDVWGKEPSKPELTKAQNERPDKNTK